MTAELWKSLQFFSRHENWGDPEKMDADFVQQLDHFRGIIGKPFVLTCAAFATHGHSENSYHYKGRAADGRFVDSDTHEALSIKEHILIALRAPFGGVGIYTHSSLGPFLHFDNRVATYDRKIWTSEKEGHYENLSIDFLSRYLGGN